MWQTKKASHMNVTNESGVADECGKLSRYHKWIRHRWRIRSMHGFFFHVKCSLIVWLWRLCVGSPLPPAAYICLTKDSDIHLELCVHKVVDNNINCLSTFLLISFFSSPKSILFFITLISDAILWLIPGYPCKYTRVCHRLKSRLHPSHHAAASS